MFTLWRQAAALVVFLRWALGFPSEPRAAGSHGFSSETLLPERSRTIAERAIALITSSAVLWTLLNRFLDTRPPHLEASLVLGAGGIAWGIRMLLPKRPPMDRTALTLGFYTLAPWLTAFIFSSKVVRDDVALGGFWRHLGGFVLVAAIGLAIDIRREIREKDKPE